MTNIIWTVKDGSGNTATCNYSVTVTDNQPPTISCPGNYNTFDDPGVCYATVLTSNPLTADNCSVSKLIWSLAGATTANSPITGINNIGTFKFNTGISTVTYTVYDKSGNTATCSFTVTVINNQNPIISCPGNRTEYLNKNCQFTIPDYTGLVLVTDNCNGPITLTQNPVKGTIVSGSENTNLITVTAKDIYGNSSSCTFIISLSDTIKPTPVCKNITVYLDQVTGKVSITPDSVNNGSYDNCGITNYTLNNYNFNCHNLGINNITLTIADIAGNTASCVSAVDVRYSIIPIAMTSSDGDTLCDNQTIAVH